MNLNNIKKIDEFRDKSLLIVDDDNPFRERLARAMEKKGFQVTQAEGVKKGIETVGLAIVMATDTTILIFLPDRKSVV